MPRHRYVCALRWGDLDAQGHLNNAAYLDYLQEARVDFLITGPAVMTELLHTGVLVVAHAVEYLEAVTYSDEPLTIELWVSSIGASRFVVDYEVRLGDLLVARARTAATPFDLATNRLRRLKPAERGHLQAHLDTPLELRALPRMPVGPAAARYPLRVRWSDLDSYGHANNVKYFDYVQEARIALLGATVQWSSTDTWVIVRQDLEYRQPLDFRREPYEVRTSVSAVGTRSFTVAIEIVDPAAGITYATARTVVVGSRPITGAERAALAQLR